MAKDIKDIKDIKDTNTHKEASINLHEEAQEIHNDDHKFFKSTKIFLSVFLGPLLCVLYLVLVQYIIPYGENPRYVESLQTSKTVPINQVDGYQWLNLLSFVFFISSICFSFWVAQKYELVGSYGEVITLLIPTFVWLLPKHEAAMQTLTLFALTLIAISILFFIGTTLIGIVAKKNQEHYFWKELVIVFFRLGYTCILVASTLLISIVLIYWGDYGMKFSISSITKEVDYGNTSWIMFVGGTILAVALSMVILGLSETFTHNYRTISSGKKRKSLFSKIMALFSKTKNSDNTKITKNK